MRRIIFLFLLLGLGLQCKPAPARTGIVVAAADRYMEYLLPSIRHLRTNLHCTLPIEVWHSGDELSEKSMQALAQFENVHFRDISEALYCDPSRYRGWHVKPWLIYLSSFDEVILMDADVYFYEDPRILFSHPGYRKTGAFFFRDRGTWIYKTVYQALYLIRRAFFRSLISSPSKYMPPDWTFFWGEDLPTDEMPRLYHYMESGCLAIRKKDHIGALRNIIRLNEDREVTYKHMYGDKETYWLGFEMAGEPYYVNHLRACELRKPNHEEAIKIVHFLDGGKLFFSQKHPIVPEPGSYFWDEYPCHNTFQKPITEEEREKILQGYQIRQ